MHPAKVEYVAFWKRVWGNGVRALTDKERGERDRLLAAIPDEEIARPYREAAALVAGWAERQRHPWSNAQLIAHSKALSDHGGTR